MVSLRLQLTTFLNMIVIGMIIGLSFDFYRAVRRKIAFGRIITDICDVLFSLLAVLLICGGLIYSNNGRVRFYFLLGVSGGLASYYFLFSNLIISFFLTVFDFIEQLLNKVKGLIKIIYNHFKKIFSYFRSLIIKEDKDG